MKNLFNPGRVICALLCAVMVFLAVNAWNRDLIVTADSSALIPAHKAGIGALTMDGVAAQTFLPGADNLNAVEVMVSKYAKKPKTGTLYLTVKDAVGNTLGAAEYAVADVKDNSWVEVRFDAPVNLAGQPITLYAASDCTDQKGVTLRMGPGAELPDGTALTLADGTADTEGNALNLRMQYTVVTHNWMSAATLALLALCLLACVPLSGKRREAPHA